MVRADGVADFRFLLVLFRELHSEQCVRKIGILIGNLSYVVEESRPLRRLCVESEFRCHGSGNVGHLTGMLEKVLAIRRTVFHTADELYQFDVDAVDAEVDAGAFADFENLILKLLLDLGHHLLDACRVDAAVDHKLMQRQTRNLPADRVEGGKENRIRSVIHDNLHTRGGLKSPDVASFAPDYAPLDFIAFDVEHRDGILNRRLRSRPLNRVDYDSLGFLGRIQTGVVNHIIDVGLSLGPRLRLHVFHEYVLRLGSRHPRDVLNLAVRLLAEPVILGRLPVGNLHLRLEVFPD